MDKRYRFTEDSRIITNNDRVLIVNRDNGSWLKISKQCYDVLTLGIQHNLTINELLESLADDEDRDYFNKLFEKLINMELMTDEISIEEGKVHGIKKIDQIYFALTNRCNLRCIHCCINAGQEADSETLSTGQVLSAIDKILTVNPANIVFSGGEPMLREDLFEILEYTAQRYNGKITLATNGTLINEENVHKLTELCYQIDISLDGVDEESCSIIRGSGVFDKVMKSVRLLQNNEFKNISLSMVIGEKTQHLEEQFNSLNASLGTIPMVRVFSPIGRGEINDLAIMDKKSKTTFIPKNFKQKLCEKPIRGCSCGAGCHELYINSDGGIYPCPNLTDIDYKICNISEISDLTCLKNIENGKFPAFNNLSDIEPDSFYKCKECKVNVFCWTCLNELKRLKNCEDDFEERCSVIKPVLNELVWGKAMGR
ncbi:radical SAM protein [Ruminiclostridium josui]|uniref:radical SAM protein n=1 Tax=Ruminiclostridium josui TaxID=1499 RepID=UPI00046748B3|nr:radical SAM protein [Ruminiclostridium josui]